MSMKIISTQNAPAAVGPYSQAVAEANLIFCSGQLGLVPETGKLAEGGIAAQAEQSLKNLQAVLQEAGSDMAHIVKTTIFLTDIGTFKTVNEVYKKFFTGDCPARSCFAVKELPLGGLVEIEAIAVKS